MLNNIIKEIYNLNGFGGLAHYCILKIANIQGILKSFKELKAGKYYCCVGPTYPTTNLFARHSDSMKDVVELNHNMRFKVVSQNIIETPTIQTRIIKLNKKQYYISESVNVNYLFKEL